MYALPACLCDLRNWKLTSLAHHISDSLSFGRHEPTRSNSGKEGQTNRQWCIPHFLPSTRCINGSSTGRSRQKMAQSLPCNYLLVFCPRVVTFALKYTAEIAVNWLIKKCLSSWYIFFVNWPEVAASHQWRDPHKQLGRCTFSPIKANGGILADKCFRLYWALQLAA